MNKIIYKDEINRIIPPPLQIFAENIDEKEFEYLIMRNGMNYLIEYLQKKYNTNEIVNDDKIKYEWIGLSLFYRYYNNQYPNALALCNKLYEIMIKYQIDNDIWVHKGLPLVFIRDYYILMNCPVMAKRYAMLTLCEDSIGDYRSIGKLKKNEAEIYSKLTYYHKMTENEIDNYFKQINNIFDDSKLSRFPEWILQKLDNNWITNFPTENELLYFDSNKYYIKELYARLEKDKNGEILEILAEYILSVIPGMRTKRRVKSYSTDYDILFSIEGQINDFRSELGRYVICECKNWKNRATFSTIAKFSNVIESANCKCGIMFSKNGVTGADKTTDAKREILKIYQRNGINMIVIDKDDINKIINGDNFITVIRNKYENNRFDIR